MNHDLIIYSINLLIEISKRRSLSSIDALLESISELLEEEELEEVLNETAIYLQNTDPELCNWFIWEIIESGMLEDPDDEYEEDEDEDEEDYYLCSVEDIIHLLLDEGLSEPKDFIRKGEQIEISAGVRDILEQNFNLHYVNDYIIIDR